MGLVGTPAHNGQPLSPVKRRQQRSLPRSSATMCSAGPAVAPEVPAAGKLTVASGPRSPMRRRDSGHPHATTLPDVCLGRLQERGAALQGAAVLQQAYAPALLAARAAAKAAVDPGNGRPPARVLAGLTRRATAGDKPPHCLQCRPSAASLVARRGRRPMVLTLAQLQKRYGGRRQPHRAAAEPAAKQTGSLAAVHHMVDGKDRATEAPEQTASADQGASVGGACAAAPQADVAAAGVPGGVGGVAEPNWEWMVEGVLRQVVLHLDTPNSVVRFRQVQHPALILCT